MTFKALPQA